MDPHTSLRAISTSNASQQDVAIASLIMDDPVAIACVSVVFALFLCLCVALFVRYQNSTSPLTTQRNLKVPLDSIPLRCHCCTNPGSRKAKHPKPILSLYIPEVTEEYVFKMWEAQEISQTSNAPAADDML